MSLPALDGIVTHTGTTVPIEGPYPHAAPSERTGWVGDFRDLFGAGHGVELHNLKTIAEYRHRNGLQVTPAWMR